MEKQNILCEKIKIIEKLMTEINTIISLPTLEQKKQIITFKKLAAKINENVYLLSLVANTISVQSSVPASEQELVQEQESDVSDSEQDSDFAYNTNPVQEQVQEPEQVPDPVPDPEPVPVPVSDPVPEPVQEPVHVHESDSESVKDEDFEHSSVDATNGSDESEQDAVYVQQPKVVLEQPNVVHDSDFSSKSVSARVKKNWCDTDSEGEMEPIVLPPLINTESASAAVSASASASASAAASASASASAAASVAADSSRDIVRSKKTTASITQEFAYELPQRPIESTTECVDKQPNSYIPSKRQYCKYGGKCCKRGDGCGFYHPGFPVCAKPGCCPEKGCILEHPMRNHKVIFPNLVADAAGFIIGVREEIPDVNEQKQIQRLVVPNPGNAYFYPPNLLEQEDILYGIRLPPPPQQVYYRTEISFRPKPSALCTLGNHCKKKFCGFFHDSDRVAICGVLGCSTSKGCKHQHPLFYPEEVDDTFVIDDEGFQKSIATYFTEDQLKEFQNRIKYVEGKPKCVYYKKPERSSTSSRSTPKLQLPIDTKPSLSTKNSFGVFQK